MSREIAGSPLSRHDIETINVALNAVRTAGCVVSEIQLSDQRLTKDSLRLFGLPVRRASLALHEALLICDGHRPIPFRLEDKT